jgi:hypothetical protein
MDDVIALFLENPDTEFEFHVPDDAAPNVRRAAENLHRMIRDIREWVRADPARARAFLEARRPHGGIH